MITYIAYSPASARTLSYGLLAVDGKATTFANAWEYLLAVNDTMWWSGDLGAGFDSAAKVTDMTATATYPGPSNFTVLANPFDTYSWVHIAGYVWSHNATTIWKVNDADESLSSWSVSVPYSLHKSPSGDLWARTSGTGMEKLNQSNPTTSTGVTRTWTSSTLSHIVFVGGTGDRCYAIDVNDGKLHWRDNSAGGSNATLSGTGAPSFVVWDTDRGSLWIIWPNNDYVVEFDLSSQTEANTYTVAFTSTGGTGGACYDATRQMIWIVHGSGSGRVVGISTADGSLVFDEAISIAPNFTPFTGNVENSTLCAHTSGAIVCSGFIAENGDVFDDETVLVKFEYS